MDKLTKHDSVLWINHAIAYFESIDKTQKELADTLGIEASRMSEMKKGKGTVSPNLMEKIIDLCGAPRRNPGRYEKAEIYESFHSFQESYIDATENRFVRRLIKIFSNPKNIEVLSENCFILDDNNSKTSETANLTLIDELIRTEKFSEICHSYIEWLKTSDRPSIFDGWGTGNFYSKVLQIANIGIYEFKLFHFLYLLWTLVSRISDFKLSESGKEHNILPLVDVQPVIMTGSKILDIKTEYGSSLTFNSQVKQLFGHDYPKLYSFSSDFSFHSGIDTFAQPDNWAGVECELYLSENMNYHLFVNMTSFLGGSNAVLSQFASETDVYEDPCKIISSVDPDTDRLIVISNINTLELLSVIEEVRKWCGLSKDSHHELNQRIAFAGGHVSGAHLLI